MKVSIDNITKYVGKLDEKEFNLVTSQYKTMQVFVVYFNKLISFIDKIDKKDVIDIEEIIIQRPEKKRIDVARL
jgi:hypothetical protein